MSIIQLALAPEIKYNVLKETIPNALWEKLDNVKVTYQLTLFEGGLVPTQNGDEMKFT